MNQIGIGISSKTDLFGAGTEASFFAKSSIENSPHDLALIFTKYFNNPRELIEWVTRTAEAQNLIGLSSNILLSSSAQDDISLISILPRNDYLKTKVSFVEIDDKPPRTLGEKLASSLSSNSSFNKHCLLIFCPNSKINIQEVIRGAQAIIGKSFPIFGLVPSMQENNPNFLYSGRDIKTNIISGILIGGNIKIGFAIDHGWKPLGKLHKITKSKNNMLYEIDNKPAINIYNQYFENKFFQWSRQYFHKISFTYPLGIITKNENEHILRSGLLVGDNGSIICQGEIPRDSSVRMMISTRELCLESATKTAKKAIADFDISEIKLILCFSSIARYNLLGRKHPEEIEKIKQLIGNNIPIVGCRSFAEIAPLNSTKYLGESYIHNNSMLVLAMGDQ